MIIDIHAPFGPAVLRLTPNQVKLFNSEFVAARRRSTRIGAPLRAAPDCDIVVRRKGGPRQLYRLYYKSSLLEVKSNRRWPFYFGMLLLEWMDAALPPLPQVPARPVPP